MRAGTAAKHSGTKQIEASQRDHAAQRIRGHGTLSQDQHGSRGPRGGTEETEALVHGEADHLLRAKEGRQYKP